MPNINLGTFELTKVEEKIVTTDEGEKITYKYTFSNWERTITVTQPEDGLNIRSGTKNLDFNIENKQTSIDDHIPGTSVVAGVKKEILSEMDKKKEGKEPKKRKTTK